MSKSQSTTRETKATELIQTRAVTLYVGQGVAEVKGSKGETYRVTSTGCTCPDSQRRQVDCKHVLATKALCAEYHRLKLAAELGETIRPSAALVVGSPDNSAGWGAGAPLRPNLEDDMSKLIGTGFGPQPVLCNEPGATPRLARGG